MTDDQIKQAEQGLEWLADDAAKGEVPSIDSVEVMEALFEDLVSDAKELRDLKAGLNDLKEALKSAGGCLATSSRDWSLESRDAWLWGILCGWGKCVDELSKKFGWFPTHVHKLEKHREAVRLITGDVDEDD